MHQLSSYLKEREGFDSIVTECGFASYRISGDECYIRDIWVNQDFRKKHIASAIAHKIEEIAKKAGCKYLTGSVDTAATNPTQNTKVLLSYGFDICGIFQTGILFRKDI